MRFLHVTTRLILLLILLAAIAAGVYFTLGGDDVWRNALTRLCEYRGETLAASLGLACILAIHLLSYTSPRHLDTKFVTFRSPAGNVSISVRAIRDFLQRLVTEFPAVKEMHTVIRHRRNGLSATVELRVSTDEYVPEVCQMVQERIREALTDQLGIPRLGAIEVRVKDIQGPVPAARQAEEVEEVGI